MNYDELNNFIKHYIENDKTQRAIMLTGGWGIGKSHYIQNELIPFLLSDENSAHQCIVVSLYGLSRLSEISKTIYLESRMKFINKKSEKTIAGKMAAKTVLKGITSFFNIDISKSEDEMIELYESINLSQKLIILEDVERSNINILDVLGYVNNLVEQDEVKILLVSNEDEIIKFHYSEPDKNGKMIRILENNSIEYLKIKEKTVSDTVLFHCNFYDAINAIISRFNNDKLNFFSTNDKIKDILDIMRLENCYNLRSFIYACQKTADILDKSENDEIEFKKTIFYSIIAFCLKIKNGDMPEWKDSGLVSFELGIRKYPLYRFCYDYIRWQEFDQDKVSLAIESHKKIILYNRHGAESDSDLIILFNYYDHTEHEVLESLSNIYERLSDPESIPYYDYGRLAYYLISCNTILGYDYKRSKEKMINNIKGKRDIDIEILFLPFHEFENPNEKDSLNQFKLEIKEAINHSDLNDCIFSYKSDELNSFYNNLIQDNKSYFGDHRFISKFDNNKLAEMLFKCTPSQIGVFRGIMFAVYRYATSQDFLKDDLTSMIAFRDVLANRLEKKNDKHDRIALYQIRLLLRNLNDFIKQLSS